MKNIILISFIFLFNSTYGQVNLNQLRERLNKQPSNSSIEVISRVGHQNLTIDTVKNELFDPQIEINQSKIIKYNDLVQKVSQEDILKYKDKLSLNLTGDRVIKIPEYHLEISEDSGVGDLPLIFSPMFTNLKPLIYDPDNEEGFTSNLSFILFSENGENEQKI